MQLDPDAPEIGDGRVEPRFFLHFRGQLRPLSADRRHVIVDLRTIPGRSPARKDGLGEFYQASDEAVIKSVRSTMAMST